MSKDKILGMISIVVAALIAVMTALTVDPIIRIQGDPGARIFPYMSAVLFAVPGLVLLLRKQEGEERIHLKPEQWKRLFILFGVMCAYVVLIWLVGFILATAVMLFVVSSMFAVGKNISLVQRLLYSAATTVAVYVIFRYGLKIYLTKGLLDLI